jgi:hypothetical protein
MGMLDRFRRRRAVPPLWTDVPLDGGWRAVRPITPVLRRTDTRVAPGLPFRDGLASWRDVTFGTPLGHAVGGSAPVGTMHGVVRYRTPGPSLRPGGGPLRLLRSPDAGAIPDEPTSAPAPVVARRPIFLGRGTTSPVRSLPAVRSTDDLSSAQLDNPVPAVRHEPVVRRAADERPQRPLLADDPPPVEVTTPPVSRAPSHHRARSGIGEPLTSMPATAVLPSATSSDPSPFPAIPMLKPKTPPDSSPLPGFPATAVQRSTTPSGTLPQSVADVPVSGGRPLLGSMTKAIPDSGVVAGVSSSGAPPLPGVVAPLPVSRVASPQDTRSVDPRAAASSPDGRQSSGGRPSDRKAAGSSPADSLVVTDVSSSGGRSSAGSAAGSPAVGSAASEVPLPVSGTAAAASNSVTAGRSQSGGDASTSGHRPLLGSVADAVSGSVAAASAGERPNSASVGVSLPLAVATGSGDPPPTNSAPAGASATPVSRAVAAASSSVAASRSSSPITGVVPGALSAAGTAAPLPVLQRSAGDSVERASVTRLARAAGVGPVPGVPSYRIVPLLSARRLVRPAVSSHAPPNRVAPAVWRRPAAPTGTAVHPVALPATASGPGVDIIAMAPARPAPSSALPVTRVQRDTTTVRPPRPRSVSAPPALPATVRPPEPARAAPKPDPLAGIEMDKLARQLFEPISRLLRTDLRRGRERAGTGQDHRR